MRGKVRLIGFSNGLYPVPEVPYMSPDKLLWEVRLSRDADHGDWKTAMARNLRPAKKGEPAVLMSVMENYYGQWAQLRLEDGTMIDVSPMAVVVESMAAPSAPIR